MVERIREIRISTNEGCTFSSAGRVKGGWRKNVRRPKELRKVARGGKGFGGLGAWGLGPLGGGVSLTVL